LLKVMEILRNTKPMQQVPNRVLSLACQLWETL
jgi:hypothetical protein